MLLKLLEGLKEETGGQNPYMQIPTPKIGKTIFFIFINKWYVSIITDSNIISSQRLIKSYCFTGIGMDSSITPLRHGGLSLVQTTDFFYPLVEDPYMQGKLMVRNAKKKF